MKRCTQKLLVLVLVCLLSFGVAVPNALAYTLEESAGLSELYAKRIYTFAEHFTATDDEALALIDLKILGENVADCGYDLCFVFSGYSTEEEGEIEVDGFVYKYFAAQKPYALGYYLINDTDALTLTEACEKGVITLKGAEGEQVRRLITAPLVEEAKTEPTTSASFDEPDEPTDPNEPTTTASFDEPVEPTEPTKPTEPTTAVVTEPTEVPTVEATEPTEEVITPQPDYSKLSGGLYEKLRKMTEEDKALVLLYLKVYDEGISDDMTEEEIADLYKEREAANYNFLEKYPNIKGEDEILFVGQYYRRVIVYADKSELETFCLDSEIRQVVEFEQNLNCPKTGYSGAELYKDLEEYIGECGNGAIDNCGAVFEKAGESGNVPMVKYTILPTADETRALRYGNYIFVSSGINACYHLGFFAVIDGEFMPFEEALEKNLINLDEAAKIYGSAYEIENLGDMDGNGKVNIKDATYLQKALAGIVEMPKITVDFQDFRDFDVTDFNNDGKLNIRDATAIQKHIAKIGLTPV